MHFYLLECVFFIVMKIFEIIKFIERWAPRGSAWERDNPGLQVGSEENILKNVFICLELTEETLNEALEFNSNFIISHHPLIFNPLKRINTTKDPVSILINKLIKNDITLYSAHTNLDFTLGGVSFALAKLLKLKNIKFLRPLEQNQSKIVVFVPENELQKVSDAIFKAGGGVIGNYKKCSYRLKGEGTFEGGGDSNPTVGERGVFESVEEVRLEVVVNNWMIGKVVDAIRSSHSYEEPAFDIYPLKNGSVNYGAGAIGDFDIPYSSSSFLEELLCVLDIPVLKHSAVSETDIKKVAVCGGVEAIF